MAIANGVSEHHSDVCIVGGGPTGLLLAINLAQAGLKVTVFEANTGFSTAFRAIGHIPAVFPELAKVGILERTKKVSTFYSGRILFRRATDLKVVEAIEPMPGRPGPMVLPQGKLTKIMVDRLAELADKAELLMGHRVTGFSDEGAENGVTVDVVDVKTDEKKVYTCKYLVGADGAKSFTRRTLGLSYEGQSLPFKLVAADLFYPFEQYGWDGANFMLDTEMFGNIALVDTIDGESLWRIGIGFPIDMTNEEIAKELPKRYQAMFPQTKDRPFTYRHHTEPTPYEAHHLCASRLRKGNVLLIGDAAHIANPFSGQVLAFGIFDASALSDCIIAVEKMGRPDSLLDEWSEDRIFKFKTILDPLARACFEAVSHPDTESIGSRHPFLRAMKAGPSAGPPPSLATKVEGLRSWSSDDYCCDEV